MYHTSRAVDSHSHTGQGGQTPPDRSRAHTGDTGVGWGPPGVVGCGGGPCRVAGLGRDRSRQAWGEVSLAQINVSKSRPL